MTNIGSLDRTLRFVLGIVFVVAAFLPQVSVQLGDWRYLLAAVGAVLVGTAAFRICPAYLLFGIRTCAIGKA